MLKSRLASIVSICTRHAWIVIIVAAIVTVVTAAYSVHNFAINTDVNKLISSELPWRQRELEVDKAFPHRKETIIAVVEAPNSELATQATATLLPKLIEQNALFQAVREPGGGEFFSRNGLLFLSAEEVGETVNQFAQAQPLVQVLVADPTLRGFVQALTFALAGLQRNMYTLDQMARPLTLFATTLEHAAAGQRASFSWRELVSRKPTEPRDLRRIFEITPVLDYSALEPGEKPIMAIRKTVADLKLDSEYGARVRLTGPVPIQDEEFATLKENAELNAMVSLAFLIGILWLALRSARIVIAVLISIFVGLSVTAALGLMMVGSLNPISIAFAVLFVGIGVDFGIQFSVRYRAERHEKSALREALLSTAASVGVPLTLAAAATAAGFLSFLPTHYRGLSELGLIAGSGMIIAFITSVTLLPALLAILSPPGEPEPLGYAALAPVDSFLERFRVPIIAGTLLIAAAGLPLLLQLKFDFNPINLRSPSVESVATFLKLRNDPTSGINSIDILAANLQDADATAARLRGLPEVERTMTLSSLVPDSQDAKIKLIGEAREALAGALETSAAEENIDTDNVSAIEAAASALMQTAGEGTSPGPVAARRLADGLAKLAEAQPAKRAEAHRAIIPPLEMGLKDLSAALQPEPVRLDTLPPDIVRDWVTPDGRARISVAPKGDPNDNEVLRSFARAVLKVEPRATGTPVSIQESGRTIVWAFIQAGFFALLTIAILLWITLRRFGDVLLTLVPLILAGAVTLEICVLIGLPLNFANIIALPLLLGIGVAFKIYYIMAWRAGQTNLLQSSLTRAVMFSAMTTATAFGSLWLSKHPGTSSMGKLMALSLICTLAAAVLFQPALMGKPRQKT